MLSLSKHFWFLKLFNSVRSAHSAYKQKCEEEKQEQERKKKEKGAEKVEHAKRQQELDS